MRRVEGKFTARQEERTQLGKCGRAEQQKEPGTNEAAFLTLPHRDLVVGRKSCKTALKSDTNVEQ